MPTPESELNSAPSRRRALEDESELPTDFAEEGDQRRLILPIGGDEHSEEDVQLVERIATKAANKAILVAVRREMFSGPLPKPEHLRQYGEIVPSAPQDIIDEFKANGKHVRECEKLGLKGAIIRDFISQIFAFLLAIIAISAAIYMELNGHTKVAIALIVLTGSGLVAPFLNFINRKKGEKKDESEEEES